jgi:hypothetical protein
MNPRASRLNLNHPSRRCRCRHAFVAAHLTRLGNRDRDEQWSLRGRRFQSLRSCAFSPIMQQPAVDPVPTRHRCDIGARLEALRQNSRPLLITPAQVARRPRDQLDPAIAIIAIATVLMSVTMTVILHGAIQRIQGPLRMLSDAARLGRCVRRAIAVPLTLYFFPGPQGHGSLRPTFWRWEMGAEGPAASRMRASLRRIRIMDHARDQGDFGVASPKPRSSRTASVLLRSAPRSAASLALAALGVALPPTLRQAPHQRQKGLQPST